MYIFLNKLRIYKTLELRDNKPNLDNWIDPKRDGGGPLSQGSEVRHAGDDADVGLLPDLEQRLGEDVQTAARQDLRRLHQGVCSDGRLGDVATEVRIQDEREDARLRHRDGKKPLD